MKEKLYKIIFEADTTVGKYFDLVLIYLIGISVLVVILESIPSVGNQYSSLFWRLELVFTFLFTIEYLARVYVSPNPIKYVFSFWGLIDLLSILPTFLSVFFVGYHYLSVIRIFRLLRIFRILKLVRFNKEAGIIIDALKASYYKIFIFLLAVFFLTIILGTLMYVVEGGEKGFTSIPQSIYWAIVTITTVGYGDIVPATALGKILSSIIMLLGYAIIAVPTGIVTVALNKNSNKSKQCNTCKTDNIDSANYCINCGTKY